MAEQGYTTGSDVIDRARDLVRQVESVDGHNRQRAERALSFKAGEQWDPSVKLQRESGDNPLPCLVLNEMPTMTAQITNDFLQNPPGVMIQPVDQQADAKTAEVLMGMRRHLLAASLGENAPEVAFTSAVDTGLGFWRLVADYVSEDSFDQEIKLCSLPYPQSVYFDPHSLHLDGSDAKDCVILSTMRRQDFTREYPEAEALSTSLIGADSPGGVAWITEETVAVAEYYCCEYEPDVLIQVSTGQTLWRSQLQDPRLIALVQQVGVVQERPVQRPLVKWYKHTAADLLEERTLPGKYLPVVPVYGNRILRQATTERFGLIALLEGLQVMLNYWESTKTILLGMQPRQPWLVPDGGDVGYEDEWRRANSSTAVALHYNTIHDATGQPLAMPTRQPFVAPPTGVIEAAAHAREMMREISGIHQPAQLTPGSNRSRASLREEDSQAAMSTYHYFFHVQASLLHTTRIWLSWVPAYYDRERVVQIVGEDGQSEQAVLNQRQPGPGGIERVVNDVTVGTYGVVLSAGPNYQTKREEALENMKQLGGVWPKFLDTVGSDFVRVSGWPGAEQIANKLAMTEPQVPGEDVDPAQALPQVLGQLQKVQQEAQALNAHAQQLEQAMQKLSLENQALKSDRQADLAEVQVKQAELILKERELALQAQEVQWKHDEAMLNLQIEREKVGVQARSVEVNGRDDGDTA